jgi:hypothetical protein
VRRSDFGQRHTSLHRPWLRSCCSTIHGASCPGPTPTASCRCRRTPRSAAAQLPERHRVDEVLVGFQRRTQRPACVQVPHPQREVVAGGHRDRAAAQLPERHRQDVAVVALQRRAQRSPHRQVPHPHGVVVAAGDRDRAAVQLPHSDRVDLALVPFQRLVDQRSGVQVPHPHRRVIAARDGDRPGGRRAHRHRCAPVAIQARLEGRRRVARYRARAPCPFRSSHLNRQQCPPGHALAPADTARTQVVWVRGHDRHARS